MMAISVYRAFPSRYRAHNLDWEQARRDHTPFAVRTGQPLHDRGLYNLLVPWLADPRRPGLFLSHLDGDGYITVFFSDANLAFEFKMRWG